MMQSIVKYILLENFTWGQERDVIITILSDKEYMENLYNSYRFIREMEGVENNEVVLTSGNSIRNFLGQ